MLSDQSIKEKKDDLLQRYPFAEKIARIIASQSNKDPLVISINGPWGDGKSTVFEFLETELKQKEVPTLVFNPWRYPHEDDLLRAFFVELAETLDDDLLTKGEKLAKQAREKMWWFKDGVFGLLKEAGKLQTSPESPKSGGWFRVWITTLLSPFVSGLITNQMVGSLLSHVGAWLTPSIQELRERLKKKLMLNEKRIAVLLDDPDRLEAEELFALFRLIKLTADFPYTTFVLAMDYDAVAKTVGSRFGSDEQGRKFLEKIVQVPLRLPAVPRLRLAAYAMDLVREALAGLQIDLPASEWSRFQSEFDSFILPRIKTPRLAKRYANIITFTLGLTAGQVNEVDVMLMEALRLFETETFHRLMDHLSYTSEPLWPMLNHEDSNLIVGQTLEEVLPPKHASAAKSELRGVLERLFPFRFTKPPHTVEDRNRLQRKRRVGNDDYLIRYAACALPENDIPDSDIADLLDLAASEDAEVVSGKLEFLYNEKTGAVLMQRLLGNMEQLSEAQCGTLVPAIAGISRHFSSESQSTVLFGVFGQAIRIVVGCVSRVSSPEQRERLLTKAIELSEGWLWGVALFKRLLVPVSREVMGIDATEAVSPFRESELGTAGKILAARIMDDFEVMPDPPTLNRLIWTHRVLQSYAEPRRLHEWSHTQITKNHSYATNFLRLHKWSAPDDGSFFLWPPTDGILQHMSTYVDLKWLAEQRLSKPPVVEPASGDGITIEEAVCRLIDLLPKPPPPAPPPENPPDALPG